MGGARDAGRDLSRFSRLFRLYHAKEGKCTPPTSTMLRPSLVPRIGASCRTFRRSLHNVPRLSHDFANEGVPGFLGPAGFDIAWTQYQSLMVERLNRLTAGMSKNVDTVMQFRLFDG